jgi:predicted porin
MNRNARLVAAAMAVFLLIGSGAIAGEAEYDIFGRLHGSINGVSDSSEQTLLLTSNASRLGLWGSYQIRDGFAVIGQVEVQFNSAQDEFATFTSRNTFFGLKGRYGTLLGGNHDIPLRTLGRKITYFEDTIGDFRSTTMGVDKRLDEVILYELPHFDNGLGGQLSYRIDQGDWTDSTAATADAFSGILTFAPGDFLVGVGYQSAASGNFNPNPEEAESESVFRAVGQFDNGSFGLSALYQGIDNFGGTNGLTGMTVGLEGMFMPSPQWRIKALYYGTDPNTNLDDDSYAQLALGVDHPMDAVTFYLQYAVLMNDDNQRNGLGGNDWGGQVMPSEAGKSASGLSLGFWWDF